MRWTIAHKYDPRCVRLADRHYSRQSPGSPQFCRPGFNLTLYTKDSHGGEAVFNWWRPRWDIGRSDGLRAIECTIFRNETWWLSSDLIIEATAAVQCWAPEIWPPYQHVGAMLITSVNSEASARRRSRHHAPGWCFRCAGWVDFDHAPGRADVWLRCPPHAQPHPRRASMTPPDQMELW